MLARLSTADAALAKTETLAAELKDPYLISRILPRREAVSSSSIEGTNSTLDELLSLEENEDSEQGNAAAVQVRDYALALEDLLPRARVRRHALSTAEFVQDLHRAVMKGDTDFKDAPGELRKVVVWIGGAGHIANSTYNPTPPDNIPIARHQHAGSNNRGRAIDRGWDIDRAHRVCAESRVQRHQRAGNHQSPLWSGAILPES